MRIFLITLFSIFLTTNAFCIFGIEKILPDLNLFKQEIKGDLNGVKFQNANLKSEITGLRLQVKELKISLEANLNAVAGVGNSIQQVKGDLNQTTTNDTGLMWKIVYGLISIIVVLIGNQFFVVRWLLKEQSNSRFYQVSVAKLSKNGEFDEMMKSKKEYEKQKSLLGKLANLKLKKEKHS